MTENNGSLDKLVASLRERAKELNCIYSIEEILKDVNADLVEVCSKIIKTIPPAWQYPEICQVKIVIGENKCQSANFSLNESFLSAPIQVMGKREGTLFVGYSLQTPVADHGPFLREEKRLIETIADRIGHFVTYRKMKAFTQELQDIRSEHLKNGKSEWQVVLDLINQTEKGLYIRMAHKMLNHLCWSGIEEAKQLSVYADIDQPSSESHILQDTNRPHSKKDVIFTPELCTQIFKLAENHLGESDILTRIRKWIQEDKLKFFHTAIENQYVTLTVVADALRRFQHLSPDGLDVAGSTKKSLTVSLLRRFFTEQLQYINIAKNYVEVKDFQDLPNKVIYTSESHGKLGGKSAGLFLAERILRKNLADSEALANLRVPKTYYIASDVLHHYVHYNNLDEILEQKYKDIHQVRLEYPHIIHSFKSAAFPPEIINSISSALDDFKEIPLIVRSSSLLEDRIGAAFSGKYKSLFIANQGRKEDRLEALLDAIAEVYASTFGPDPIEYRAERGLLDFHEEMGIMIQEVVGTKMGDYFLPCYAGVAFSRNEFRWSHRIKREDGLIRLVPGLGTRAVDRTSDDYPVLIAPGQPGLRVNVTPDEIIRYAPKQIDVINLKTNQFESIDIQKLVQQFGDDFPEAKRVFSIVDGKHIKQPYGLGIDFTNEDVVVTFDGLISRSPFVKHLGIILKELEKSLNTPVDIEFASDGKHFYLLQCRPQSHATEWAPAPIPKEIPENRLIFSARKYISNGRVPDITHIVYVDPLRYGEIEDRSELVAIARTVGNLNKLLPKRQFILMGPGRWGSRGDIRLGVSVTYSEINNTAVLIEIARKKGSYQPDLSFGTHFFQDLVEAGIRYLPLYPDDEGIVFNNRFFATAPNILKSVLPDCAAQEDSIKLIDVSAATGGMILRILMNAELDEAVGILTQSTADVFFSEAKREMDEKKLPNYWRWRLRMAEKIASIIDVERFGIEAMYVFGSTKNATAGPGSDIDLLVHFSGTPEQRKDLETYLEGWSASLALQNYEQTGYKSDGLLDAHIITDEEIAKKDSFASKIGAITDPAKQLILGKKPKS